MEEMESKEETPSTQTISDNEEKPLSKRQLKKQLRREKWLETKHLRRAYEKQKKKQKLAERRERGEEIGPSRKLLKLNTMKNSACKIRVALDLSLEEYMMEKDITSLTSQIQHSYSANRRAENPMQFYACGLSGRTQQRLDGIGDYKGWDIKFTEESYLQAFPKESIVYLSSESSHVLTSLDEDKVYVIGGLVDHNSHKGLCHRLAEENGIAHAQLPISEFLHLKGRKVLAVNHVFSILLRFTETGDWKEAFMAELPTRKGFSPVFDNNKGTKGDSNSGEGDSSDLNTNEINQEVTHDSSQSISKTTGPEMGKCKDVEFNNDDKQNPPCNTGGEDKHESQSVEKDETGSETEPASAGCDNDDKS